jgi:hypothetical protein
MAEFEVLSLQVADKWNELLRQLPKEQQDIYFTPEYYRLYEDFGDGEARCFIFQKDNDYALYPFLINSVNQLGYELDKEYFDIQGAYGYNGVVSSSYDPGFIASFYRAFDSWCTDTGIIAEFTRFHPLLNNHQFSENYLQTVFDRKTVFVDLRQNYDDIFHNYQRTTRKQIKRALTRYNLKVERFENSPQILNILLPIYWETMDRTHAEQYLYFTGEYFRELLQSTPNVCFVAYQEQVPIAAIIAFYNETFIHGHLGGATTRSLEMAPFSLLYDHIIQFGIEKLYRFFHVGGGRTTAPEDALLSFKLNFSSLTADFFIGKKIHNPSVYNEIVSQWEKANPERSDKYKHHLLKYRY